MSTTALCSIGKDASNRHLPLFSGGLYNNKWTGSKPSTYNFDVIILAVEASRTRSARTNIRRERGTCGRCCRACFFLCRFHPPSPSLLRVLNENSTSRPRRGSVKWEKGGQSRGNPFEAVLTYLGMHCLKLDWNQCCGVGKGTKRASLEWQVYTKEQSGQAWSDIFYAKEREHQVPTIGFLSVLAEIGLFMMSATYVRSNHTQQAQKGVFVSLVCSLLCGLRGSAML